MDETNGEFAWLDDDWRVESVTGEIIRLRNLRTEHVAILLYGIGPQKPLVRATIDGGYHSTAC